MENYLNEIPTLVMTAIASCGGSVAAIISLLVWVVKIVKSLKAGKTDYEVKAIDYEEKSRILQERSDKLSETASTFEKFGEILTAYGKNFDKLTEQSEANNEAFKMLASTLLLIAENTPALVQNGTAKAVKRLLFPNKTENTVDTVAQSEANGETNS